MKLAHEPQCLARGGIRKLATVMVGLAGRADHQALLQDGQHQFDGGSQACEPIIAAHH